MTAPLIPGVTWGRSRQTKGWGRWHLLVELRRNVSGAPLVGRWGTVPAGGVFAVALCGQVVNEAVWDPGPRFVPYSGWGMPGTVPVPATDWCLPCLESANRQAGSVPA